MCSLLLSFSHHTESCCSNPPKPTTIRLSDSPVRCTGSICCGSRWSPKSTQQHSTSILVIPYGRPLQQIKWCVGYLVNSQQCLHFLPSMELAPGRRHSPSILHHSAQESCTTTPSRNICSCLPRLRVAPCHWLAATLERREKHTPTLFFRSCQKTQTFELSSVRRLAG